MQLEVVRIAFAIVVQIPEMFLKTPRQDPRTAYRTAIIQPNFPYTIQIQKPPCWIFDRRGHASRYKYRSLSSLVAMWQRHLTCASQDLAIGKASHRPNLDNCI